MESPFPSSLFSCEVRNRDTQVRRETEGKSRFVQHLRGERRMRNDGGENCVSDILKVSLGLAAMCLELHS